MRSRRSSSTTDRQRGQALAVFTLSLGVLLAGAALAFDAGLMIVERRDQQNAADAAAIAGARYVSEDKAKAISAATQVAAANGFSDGNGSHAVSISAPPTAGAFAGKTDYIEVAISSTRPSIVGAVMGLGDWPVSARAVATNRRSGGGRFAILSLHPTACDAMLVSGNGTLLAYGNIQVNSSCNSGALRRQGNGDIRIDVPGGACDVVGTIKDGGGSGTIQCVRNQGAPVLPDPLAMLPDPAVPSLPAAATRLSGSLATPTGCPGSTTPATAAAPLECKFESSYAGTTWRLHPGLYPGGLKLQGGTFYLNPGIYYIGGGGLTITGTGTSTYSVAEGGTIGPAGGVMFYNSALTNSAIGPVILNGSSAKIDLLPLNSGMVFDSLIIFQDRRYDINGDDVTINGSSSVMDLRGTIYVPAGDVKVNGGAGTLKMDQTIAKIYVVFGSMGSQIQILDEDEYVFKLLEAGLVE